MIEPAPFLLMKKQQASVRNIEFRTKLSRAVLFTKSKRFRGFTLAELIVVVTILAVLATVGFLGLSGYTSDAKDAAIKANVRSVSTAITSESALSNNSPRYYVVHDPLAALSGAIVYANGNPLILTGGNWNQAGTNYSAGNPDYAKLKLNPDKFKITAMPTFVGETYAAYDTGQVLVGAAEYAASYTAAGRPRLSSYFQVAALNPATKVVSVSGNYPVGAASNVNGLIKDPSSQGQFDALVEGTASRYPGCDTADTILSNGQVWASCNVGATIAWTGGISLSDCGGLPTDCVSSHRNSLGSYFQWGRNDDVTSQGSPTATLAPAGSTAGTVGHSNFIAINSSPFDWKTSPSNDNLWGGSGTTSTGGTFASQGSPTAMKGPCAPGYHVPTQAEWWSAISALNGTLANNAS